MIRIIGTKKYDTNQSIKLKEWIDPQHDQKDDDYYLKETLYRKERKGEYFLVGEGGKNTRYARRAGNIESFAGTVFIPLPFQDAIQWAHEKCTPEEYDEIFKDDLAQLNDSTEMRSMYTVKVSTRWRLRQLSLMHGLSMGKILDDLVEERAQREGIG